MIIRKVEVHNYRNIDCISVELHPECSYIIGENNLGKSNFLTLLNYVCTGKGFDDDDFSNPDMPIEINIQMQLDSGEYGFFGDNCSVEDSSLINLRYRQTISEAYPSIVCTDTDDSIQLKQIKKTNYYRYESTANPNKELKLDGKKGLGMLLNGIIEKFVLDQSVTSFLNDEKMNDLIKYINGYFQKIQGFNNYNIEAAFSPNVSDMVSRLFFLSDGERKLETTGAGVQYIAMASISVLCYIMELYKNKAIPFDSRVYTNEDGEKILPIILSIDEPEVHLHPYLQRSLIGYYKKILKNKDQDFIELLKTCFGIDGLSGQIIIVTHSTDALVGDYRNLIRFYKEEDKIKIVSGASSTMRITDANEKHLIMHFPEIKEAFYAHCAILIEGETEYGCVNAFAEKLGISLDNLGICVINARGENSIAPLRNLLNAFHIPSVAIYDGDVTDVISTGTEFFTNELCFEIEIVKKLFDAGYPELVKQIALDLYPRANSEIVDSNYLKKHYRKMGLDINSLVPCVLTSVSESNRDDFCNIYSAWYMAKKGVLLGRIAGEAIPAELIPECYITAIRKAQEVAENV
ncbi:MAG: AAA family ATPase [Peptostreptococcaceae bacterium]|nr:AAA family ATPase [Peptostreptococcaceae bacterium]